MSGKDAKKTKIAHRYYDTNFGEKYLSHWSVFHALRELIANAIDEMDDNDIPEIKLINRTLIISDKGRGLQEKHLKQSENEEKINNSKSIGRFGVGLKDAISVLHRLGKDITIESPHLYINHPEIRNKADSDEKTLHFCLYQPRNKKFIGTEITISDIREKDYKEAMEQFLIYSDRKLIYKSKFGEIYEKTSYEEPAIIYLRGIKIGERNDFLYHYNIIISIAQIDKAFITRERNLINLSDYSKRTQFILGKSFEENKLVREEVIKQLKLLESGKKHCYEIMHDPIKTLLDPYRHKSKPKIAVKKPIKSTKKSLVKSSKKKLEEEKDEKDEDEDEDEEEKEDRKKI